MTFSYYEINNTIEITNDKISTIVIENRTLYSSLIDDIYQQTQGHDGRATLYDKDRLLDLSKNIDLTTTFIPFEINRKSLVNKIIATLEKNAIANHYEETMKLLCEIEKYLDIISHDYSITPSFNKSTVSSLIKSVGIFIEEDQNNIAEKMIDYMEIVREFDGEKIFVTAGMRSYISNELAERFMKTVLDHGYKILMIESVTDKISQYEKRLTIDQDLCEF